jgi:hypothetical protein
LQAFSPHRGDGISENYFAATSKLMKHCVLIIAAFFLTKCYSQSLLKDCPEPKWTATVPQTIKTNYVKTDQVYYYKNRKNKDSTLIATQYFDSSGNLIERDVYNLKGEVVKISNFIYVDTFLMREETGFESAITVNGSNAWKEVKTYDYDSLGNVISQKEYSNYGLASNSYSVRKWSREYDSRGHLIREYYTPPEGKSFLYHIYGYAGDVLSEIKSYDYQQHWIYSNLFEFDKNRNVRTVYLYNTSKKISEELFYDPHNNLVMEKGYEGIPNIYTDHITRTYSYNSDGLLEKQTDQDIRGQIYYYKHFYSNFPTCDPIFTKVEILPTLKLSHQAFGDTLTAALKTKNFPLKDDEVTYKFVLTDKSKIQDLVAESGNILNERTLKETILQLEYLWKPATQNGHEVCAYVRLHLKFLNNKVAIEITQ